MPYCDKDLGQHWLRYWLVALCHQTITWTNVDYHQWSPMTFILGKFHKRCLNHQSLKSIWKITYLKFYSNVPGINVLTSGDHPRIGELPLLRGNMIDCQQPGHSITPTWSLNLQICHMMKSSNGKIFHVTGHLYGEFTGHQWIPRTKASNAELWRFL